jgi:putative colanic acid biosynthesis UDP-glucose lipid carrier transferase
VGRLGTSGHDVLLVQDCSVSVFKRPEPGTSGELQVLNFNLFPAWKRVFDIVFHCMVVVITCHCGLLIMLAIKTEDGGPVFFRHPRVMEGGQRFRLLEIQIHAPGRTTPASPPIWIEIMRCGSNGRNATSLTMIPRVTKVGKFLRRFNIDELPQFLNVLSGEMSVVGARPVVPEELTLVLSGRHIDLLRDETGNHRPVAGE